MTRVCQWCTGETRVRPFKKKKLFFGFCKRCKKAVMEQLAKKPSRYFSWKGSELIWKMPRSK